MIPSISQQLRYIPLYSSDIDFQVHHLESDNDEPYIPILLDLFPVNVRIQQLVKVHKASLKLICFSVRLYPNAQHVLVSFITALALEVIV